MWTVVRIIAVVLGAWFLVSVTFCVLWALAFREPKRRRPASCNRAGRPDGRR